MSGNQGRRGWYALLVRPHFERIVALQLTEQGIESYLPLLPLNQQSKSSRAIKLPLFPGYVFCKCDAFSTVWTIPGVLSLVGSNDGIHAVSEQEITDLRRILSAGFESQRSPFTSEGKPAKIEVGPLAGITGFLEEREDDRVFVFSIKAIRQSLAVKVNAVPQTAFRAGA